MWIDDPELIDKLGEPSGAVVVVTRQGRAPTQLQRMQALNVLSDCQLKQGADHSATEYDVEHRELAVPVL